MIPSSCSPAIHRFPPRTPWPNWRFGWERSSRRYRGVSAAVRKPSTVPSSGRFLRPPASRAGTCWKRFALHRTILSKGLRWISPFRQSSKPFLPGSGPLFIRNCGVFSSVIDNKRPSPCETLSSIRPLHRVAFLPKRQLHKRGAE